jgi:hypothetical protein
MSHVIFNYRIMRLSDGRQNKHGKRMKEKQKSTEKKENRNCVKILGQHRKRYTNKYNKQEIKLNEMEIIDFDF